MKKPKLQVGEVWLVRVRDNQSLSMYMVESKFTKTIELRLMYDVESEAFGTAYFAWSDVEFVEMLKS